MERQNVTLSLPKALLRKVKAIALKEEKSLSEFLKESLEERVGKVSGYRDARERQLEILKKGYDLGTRGHIGISRDEIHARS